MNKLFSNFVLFICLLLTTQTMANESNKGKVVVSAFSEFTEIAEHIPAFASWSELQPYLDKNLLSKPELSLKAIQQFYDAKLGLTPEQLASLQLYWTKNEKALGQLEAAKNKLALVTVELLSEQEQLEYYLVKAELLLLEHQLFDAAAAFKSAHAQAALLGQINVSNQVSLQLADLFYELNAKRQAEVWLANVEFDVSDNTELTTLIETSVKLAKLQSKLALYADAEQTLTSTIDHLGTKNLTAIQSSLRFQLAQVYLSWHKYDLVRELYQQAFLIAQKSRDVTQQMRALVGLMELDLLTESPWQANKTLVQADKLASYLFDQEVRLMFWQVKAKVLAAKGSYYSALAVLSKYEQAINKDKQEQQWLQMLDDKLLWQLKSGQVSSVQDTFKAYQTLSNRVSQLDTSSKIRFLQQSREFDRQQRRQEKQQTLEQVQALEHEKASARNRVATLWLVIGLMVIAASVALYWLYRQFVFDKAQSRLLDPVSGAYNHSFLVRQFAFFKSNQHRISLVMFDIDGMADINAQLGHELADQILFMMVARVKSRLLRKTWLIRISADRFVVLANNFDHKQAFVLAEIVRKELNSQDFKIAKHRVKLRASFAALECGQDQDLEAIKIRLQKTVSEAKRQGGDKTCA